MKVYAAIGHFKGSENTTSVAFAQNTKKDFMNDCYGNEFVPYVVITENMMTRLCEADCFGRYELVKKMTTNYRVWNIVTDYLDQCLDVLEEKMQAAREQA